MPTLDWLNRDAAFDIARQVPYRLLEQVSEHASTTLPAKAPPNVGSVHEKTESRQSLISGLEPTSNKALSDQANAPEAAAIVPTLAPTEDNLLIQGDNLEALKSLLPFYRGQVKCIFIDPPYNTKSAFEHYDDNLEHAQWLTMMLPRLQLLRELLREDGSIWVTIDDNEGHYLKVLMDEVFGRGNFVASFIWQKVDSPNDNKPAITPDHEFVHCYEKASGKAGFKKKTDLSLLDAYSQRDDDGRLFRDRLLKKNGKNSLRSDRPSMFFKLSAPDGSEVWPVHDDGREARWSHSLVGIEEARAEARLIWKQRTKDEVLVWIPYVREFAPGTPYRPHPTILLDVKTSRQAKAHQRELTPTEQIFDTVKPEQLIERVFDIATSPNDLILDSFLGSGTTAAVAQKMGRRWIGIEMGEHAQTHCVPRLQKVLDGEPGGISRAVNWQGGGSFRFMRLGAPIFDDSGAIHTEVKFATLAAFVWMQETRTPWASQSVRAVPSQAPGSSRSTSTSSVRTVKKQPSPFLGTRDGVAYYLLFNGILGDRRPQGGNVLTSAILAWLNDAFPHPQARSPRVIYGESVRLGPARLAAENITFKQIPYDVARG